MKRRTPAHFGRYEETRPTQLRPNHPPRRSRAIAAAAGGRTGKSLPCLSLWLYPDIID